MHVNPVLKNTSLPKGDVNSYRPISNLSFSSKVPGRVVTNRLRFHIYTSNLSNVSQSAYKQFQSTETAHLKVHNDLNLKFNIHVDKGKVTEMTLLDLSEEFDTTRPLSMWCSHRYK